MKYKFLTLLIATSVLFGSAVSVYAAPSASENSTAEEGEEEPTEPNPEMAAALANELITNHGLDEDTGKLVAQAIIEGHPDARSIQITTVEQTDYEVVVDFKADGKESSVVHEKQQPVDTTAPVNTTVSTEDISFYVGGDSIPTSLGTVTVQAASLPAGFAESGGEAVMNDTTNQYKAWSRNSGEYMDVVALIAGTDIKAASREPIVTSLIAMHEQQAGEGKDPSGVIEAIDTLFPMETEETGFVLSDGKGNHYPVQKYTTYLDMTPIDKGIGKFVASEAYLTPFNGGYIGYMTEYIKTDTDVGASSADPVTMISGLLEDPELTEKSKDEVIKTVRGKLEDADIASLTQQTAKLNEMNTSAYIGDFIHCLLLDEAKYQGDDVANVTDKDLYFHTIGEGGGLTLPASYAEETSTSENFVEYSIDEENKDTGTDPKKAAGLLAGLGTASMLMLVVSLFVSVLVLAGIWKVFAKAGEGGYKALIPILNMYTLSKIATGGALWFILTLVPFVNIAAAIMIPVKLAKSFNKSIGFGLGLALLPMFFYPMLGFSDAEYVGPYTGSGSMFDDEEEKPKKKSQKMEEIDDTDDEWDDEDDT